MSNPPGLAVTVSLPYEQAVQKTTEALKAEGFGVLTEIDVKATLKQKLDVDFRRYVILGACNPRLAFRALSANLDVGLLLPCNVTVYEEGEETVISAVNPMAMLDIIKGDEVVRNVAAEASAIATTRERPILPPSNRRAPSWRGGPHF